MEDEDEQYLPAENIAITSCSERIDRERLDSESASWLSISAEEGEA
jgi:hypothetical protein